MDAVTYPDPAVETAVSTFFVPVQINTQDDTPATHDVVRRFRQVWTPDVRILDSDGVELYRWNGYLPPTEFTARLLTGRAEALLRSGRDPEAADAYADVLRTHPTSFAAAEAAYFAGVSRYRLTHEPADLLDNWTALQHRYPSSQWRTKQSFTESKT